MTAYALDHLAIAVGDWRDGEAVLARVLGGRWRHGFRQPGFNPCQLDFANDMRIELLEPGGLADSFVGKFLAAGGGRNRPHHITFKTADIHACLASAEAAGFAPILVNTKHSVWKEGFLHPRDTGLGVLLQIVEVHGDPKEFTPAELHADCPWSAAADVAAVAVDGLLLDVEDRARAHTVLATVLGGVDDTVPGFDGVSRTRYGWKAGCQLLVAQAGPDEPGVRTAQLAVASPLPLAATPAGDGWALTDRIDTLGISLLVPAAG